MMIYKIDFHNHSCSVYITPSVFKILEFTQAGHFKLNLNQRSHRIEFLLSRLSFETSLYLDWNAL